MKKTGLTGEIVKSYLLRFPNAGARTLANKIYAENPAAFTDTESVRSRIRYYLGQNGKDSRSRLANTKFVRPARDSNPYGVPESDAIPWTPVHIPERLNNGLAFSDVHFPYHDVRAVNAMIDYAVNWKINFIFINGDGLDCYQGSKFNRDPRNRSISDEIWGWIEFLNVLKDVFHNPLIYWKLGNHCFDSKTEVLTTKGWKLGVDLDAWDVVGTLNISTNKIEYQKPDEIIKRQYTGNMYSYVGNMFDFSVTDEHRMLYRTNDTKQGYSLKKIKDIPLTPGIRLRMKHSGINDNVEYGLSDDYIKLVAWMMTDGGMQDRDNKLNSNRIYSIYQSKPNNITKILGILDRLKIGYSVTTRQRAIDNICGRSLKRESLPASQIILHRGKTGSNYVGNSMFLDTLIQDKYIFPEWVKLLSKRQFDVFIKEFVLGDGTTHRSSKVSSCIYGKKEVIEALQILCIHNGYRASIYVYRDNQYRLNLSNKQESCIDRAGTKINVEEKTDYVWCVSVFNQTVVTRRNGKVLITGNCERLENYLRVKAPELLDFSEFKLGEILKIRGLQGVEVIERQIIYTGRLPWVHGHELPGGAASPVSPARGLALKALTSSVVSHHHKSSAQTATDLNGKLMSWYSLGCLCNLHPEYALVNQWNHGFSHIQTEGLEFDFSNMKIYQGKVYND